MVTFDRLKVDDPVGATSVHLVCGIWGTLAVGIFGQGDFSVITQLVGILAIGAFTFVLSFGTLYLIKATIGIRVSEEEELHGLDVSEHDMHAYEVSLDRATVDYAG